MRILMIGNSGDLIEQLDIASGTTLEQLLHQLVPGTAPDDHTCLSSHIASGVWTRASWS